ncbi:GTP cyclohydrolase I [Bradyrhizobium sp. LM2.7]
MSSTQVVRKRLLDAGVSFGADANIAEYFRPGEVEIIQAEVEQHLQVCLRAWLSTPAATTTRLRPPMYVREVFAGRFEAAPEATDLPNAGCLEEIYALGPITVRSTCSHHFVPVIGRMWVGVLPGKSVIGISKVVRVANWIMARPPKLFRTSFRNHGGLHEECTVLIGRRIVGAIKPVWLRVGGYWYRRGVIPIDVFWQSGAP